MLLILILIAGNSVLSDIKNNLESRGIKAIKDFYLIEDFEIWPPDRFSLNPDTGVGSWKQSPLRANMYISPQTGASGKHGAEFDVWNYFEGIYGDMISDPIDLSGTTNPKISFFFWNHFSLFGKTNDDSTIVSISSDGGGSWSDFIILKGDVDVWTHHEQNLSSYIGDTILIRFRGISDNGGSNMCIDSVEIGQRPSHEAGVSAILSPDDIYYPDEPVIPVCEITSIGTDTVYNFYTYLEVDSMGFLIHKDSVLVNKLFFGKNDTIQFLPVMLPSCISYGLTFFTVYPGDRYTHNDSLDIVTNCYALRRVVVGELITNSGCPPCLPANDTLDQIFPDYPDNLALIRYHGWWPSSSDPFYLYNIPENVARITYWADTGLYAPHLYLDGDVNCEYYWDFWRDSVESETGKSTSLGIKLDGAYNYSSAAGSLYVKVFANTEPIETNLFLRYCLVENEVYFDAPNGQTEFFQAFRDMFPDTIGVPISIHMGEIVLDTQVFYIDTTTLDERNIEIVAFVQSDDNKHILQGAKLGLPVITGIKEETEKEEFIKILNAPSIIIGEISSKIQFSIKSASLVNVSIYDIAGRLRMNVINREMNRGVHSININTNELNSGLYFVLFNCNGKSEVRKITLFK